MSSLCNSHLKNKSLNESGKEMGLPENLNKIKRKRTDRHFGIFKKECFSIEQRLHCISESKVCDK